MKLYYYSKAYPFNIVWTLSALYSISLQLQFDIHVHCNYYSKANPAIPQWSIYMYKVNKYNYIVYMRLYMISLKHNMQLAILY
jgi:hypothetical protein